MPILLRDAEETMSVVTGSIRSSAIVSTRKMEANRCLLLYVVGGNSISTIAYIVFKSHEVFTAMLYHTSLATLPHT